MTNPSPESPADLHQSITSYLRHRSRPSSPLLPDIPFPLASFPPAVAAWLEATAIETRVPTAFVAFPFLAFTGGLIGRQLTLAVAPGWSERPTLWVALISPTGLGKTPALSAARFPFDALQAETWKTWRHATDGWAASPYRAAARPRFDRLLTTGTTIHALTTGLADSTGLVIVRDELYGLVRAMDRRGGEDRQHYLALWSSEPIMPTNHDLSCYIPHPVVGIVGGLQPLLLQKIRRKEQDGFLERFLLVFPTGLMEPWDETNIGAIHRPDTHAIVETLRPLRAIPEAKDVPAGFDIACTSAAAAIWSRWFNDNLNQHSVASTTMSGYYRKLPSHLARIALILHAIWNPLGPTTPLTAETMTRAVTLVEYVRIHGHRAGFLIGDHSNPRSTEGAIIERIIRCLGETTAPDGWITRTELLLSLGRPDTAVFNDIVAAMKRQEIVESRPHRPKGAGRPGTAYRLRRAIRDVL